MGQWIPHFSGGQEIRFDLHFSCIRKRRHFLHDNALKRTRPLHFNEVNLTLHAKHLEYDNFFSPLAITKLIFQPPDLLDTQSALVPRWGFP